MVLPLSEPIRWLPAPAQLLPLKRIMSGPSGNIDDALQRTHQTRSHVKVCVTSWTRQRTGFVRYSRRSKVAPHAPHVFPILVRVDSGNHTPALVVQPQPRAIPDEVSAAKVAINSSHWLPKMAFRGENTHKT
jgi:hypothetical protein